MNFAIEIRLANLAGKLTNNLEHAEGDYIGFTNQLGHPLYRLA
jgi:hypothetical protein